MLAIKKIDHVGIRVHDPDRAVSFYEKLGFRVMASGVFEKGHPIILQHECGVVINILGPANQIDSPNILMDVDKKFAGYTHMALRVESLKDAEDFMNDHSIPITGRIQFKDLRAFFVRDPDHNVIEFDEYPGEAPDTRAGEAHEFDSFKDHP